MRAGVVLLTVATLALLASLVAAATDAGVIARRRIPVIAIDAAERLRPTIAHVATGRPGGMARNARVDPLRYHATSGSTVRAPRRWPAPSAKGAVFGNGV